MPQYRDTHTVKKERWVNGELEIENDGFTSYADALNHVYNVRKHAWHSIKVYDDNGQLVYSSKDYTDTHDEHESYA